MDPAGATHPPRSPEPKKDRPAATPSSSSSDPAPTSTPAATPAEVMRIRRGCREVAQDGEDLGTMCVLYIDITIIYDNLLIYDLSMYEDIMKM